MYLIAQNEATMRALMQELAYMPETAILMYGPDYDAATSTVTWGRSADGRCVSEPVEASLEAWLALDDYLQGFAGASVEPVLPANWMWASE